jgi:NADH:ubiquinone oxidoreductase subunit 2 (subunit N)
MTLKLAILSLFLHIITFAFKKYENNKLFYHLAIGSLIILLFTTLLDLYTIREGYNLIFFSANLRASTLIFSIQFFIIFLTLVLITIYRDYKFKPEFYILLSTNILAIMFILQSNNLLIFFIAWEIFN